MFKDGTSSMKAGPSSQPTSGKPLTFWQDTVSKAEQKKLDGLVADFAFRGALSFRVMESDAAKKMFTGLRPAYQPPSAKVIGSRLLNEKYDEIKLKFIIKVRESAYYSLAVDGWTNVARTHLLNFVVILPNGDTLLWKTANVSKDEKDAENTKKEIVKVAKELSLEKWIALLQDNANMCQKVNDLIEEEFPLVFCNGCLAHGLNLFIKNVCELPAIKELFANATVLVNTINNHSRIHSFYTENIRKHLNIESGLQSMVITRFYTHYTQGKSVLDNKVGLTRLVGEHMDLLSAVLSSKALEAFLSIVNSSSFWTNLRFVVEEVLLPARIAIGVFETNSANLEVGYSTYLELFHRYKAMPVNPIAKPVTISQLLLRDFEYMHTESLGYGFILAPRHIETKMLDDDYVTTISQV